MLSGCGGGVKWGASGELRLGVLHRPLQCAVVLDVVDAQKFGFGMKTLGASTVGPACMPQHRWRGWLAVWTLWSNVDSARMGRRAIS
jgi:hypothetical protein